MGCYAARCFPDDLSCPPLSSQQPTRFSNRCLQMIGRCWPHLRALGVGGAGCGVQGLASLGESSLGTVVGVSGKRHGKKAWVRHGNLRGAVGCSLVVAEALLGRWAGGDLGSSSAGPPPSSLFLARNCMRLQVLELDHVSEITQEVAAEVCREGLKGLEMLVLTATPVTPKALLHFNSERRGWDMGWGMRVTSYHAWSARSITSCLSLLVSKHQCWS